MSDVEKAAKDYGFKLWNETGFDQETAGWCSMGFKAGAAWQRAGYDAMMADRHRVIEENARYKAALEEVASHKGMTNLHECCVNKTCEPAWDDGEKVAHCLFQFGVARGFGTCAQIALEALQSSDECNMGCACPKHDEGMRKAHEELLAKDEPIPRMKLRDNPELDEILRTEATEGHTGPCRENCRCAFARAMSQNDYQPKDGK